MEPKGKSKLEGINRKFMPGLDVHVEKARREVFHEALRKEQRQNKANERRLRPRYPREDPRCEDNWRDLRESVAAVSALAPSLSSPLLTSAARLSLYTSLIASPALPLSTRFALLSYLHNYLTAYSPYPGEASLLPMDIDTSLIPGLLTNLNLELFPGHVVVRSVTILNCLLSDDNEMVSTFISLGAIPVILKLIHTDTMEAAEHAVCTIGNIANESVEYRNAVIEAGAGRIIGEFVIAAEMMTTMLTQTAAWTIGQLLRGDPPPPADTIGDVLPALQVLSTIDDLSTKYEVMEAVTKYPAWDSSLCHALYRAELISFALDCAAEDDSKAVPNALSILGSVVENDDEITAEIVACGLLDVLERWADDDRTTVRKEVAWTVSNLATGDGPQVDRLVQHGVFAKTLQLLADAQSSVRAEAVWLCRHIAVYGSFLARQRIVSLGVVSMLKKTLYDNSDTTLNTLISLKSLYEQASEAEQHEMAETMHENHSFQYIEKLMGHRNEEVAKTAEQLVDLVTGPGYTQAARA